MAWKAPSPSASSTRLPVACGSPETVWAVALSSTAPSPSRSLPFCPRKLCLPSKASPQMLIPTAALRRQHLPFALPARSAPFLAIASASPTLRTGENCPWKRCSVWIWHFLASSCASILALLSLQADIFPAARLPCPHPIWSSISCCDTPRESPLFFHTVLAHDCLSQSTAERGRRSWCKRISC